MYSEAAQYEVQTLTSRTLFLRQRFWWRIVCTNNSQVILTSEMYVRREFRDQIARRFAERANMTVKEL
jgi:hypothetical protein